jgi:colanic acid/amylovoran biosynthesis glycosyltransferase
MNTNNLESKKVEIAIVVESFPSVSETFILNQILDLIDKGHQVTIFATKKGNTKILHQKIIDYDLLSITRYQSNQPSKITRYFYFFRDCFYCRNRLNWKHLFAKFNLKKYGKKAINLDFYLKVRWLLVKKEFDIIHIHFGTIASRISDINIFNKKSKIVVSFHGYDIHPARLATYRNTYKNLFKVADAITCNTKYTASLLEKLNFENKPFILPVGLDTNFFKRNNLIRSSKNIRIIFVGRLISLKGPEILINVFEELIIQREENLELIIIGDGPRKKHILEQVKKLGLEKKVSILGGLAQEAIKEELNNADIFVFPGIVDDSGRAETQGLVIQEAQAMELPVIVSDVGGMKYGLRDGKTGFVVKSNDVKAFAGKIKYLINNKGKRILMGKAGRAFVIKNYDSKILGDKLENIYRRI